MQQTRVLALITLSIFMACTRPTSQQPTAPRPSPVSVVAPVQWPPLPVSGFVSGRAATSEDTAAGHAAFSAQAGGVVIGKPMAITVPQYAYHVDETGQRTPGIVIQAEEVQGIRMVGFQPLGREELLAVLESEITLLGTTAPPSSSPGAP